MRVAYASGKIYTDERGHFFAIQKAILDKALIRNDSGELVDAESGNNFMYSGAADLFVLTDGRVVDRLTADELFGINASENMDRRFDEHRESIRDALLRDEDIPFQVLEPYMDEKWLQDILGEKV